MFFHRVFVSLQSVWYLLRSPIGQLSHPNITLSTSVSTGFSSTLISPSSRISASSSSSCNSSGGYPPRSRFALCVSSASISPLSSRFLCLVLKTRRPFSVNWVSYLLGSVPGLACPSALSTSLLVSGHSLFLRIMLIISRKNFLIFQKTSSFIAIDFDFAALKSDCPNVDVSIFRCLFTRSLFWNVL